MRFPSPNDDLFRVWRLLIVRAAIVLVLSIAALPWPVVSDGVMLMLVSGIAVAAGILDAAMSGALQRRVTSSWALASVLVPAFMIVHWDEASIYPVVKLLVTYALVWSSLELAVGLHLRGRVRAPAHGAAAR